jgi:arylsulfatase A-like enzyme
MIKKVADNTIVLFTSDNGPEIFTWPDGGIDTRGISSQPKKRRTNR